MPSPIGSYANRWVEIELGSGRIRYREFDQEAMKSYLGGYGIATRLLYDETGPGTDPLGPENVIIISTGTLVGTMAPTASRIDVTAKSPLTGLFGTASAGGGWGAALKYAGYDGLIIRGKAPGPVYIWIEDDKVEIGDGKEIWGKDAWESQDFLRPILDPATPEAVHVMSIGPAGENLVRYASITVDYQFNASRCGLGAVMGSKKLKAIAVKGTKGVPIPNLRALIQEARKRIEVIKNSPWQAGGALGRSVGANLDRENYNYPIKNFQYGSSENYKEAWGGPAISKYLRKVGQACHCCPVECGAEDIKDEKFGHFTLDLHPNFIIGWGALCAMKNLPAIWKCQELCERLGIDSMSASATIAFAMEIYEKGLITEELTEKPIRWGDENLVHQLLHDIANRKGFGDFLAEGSRGAAERLGKSTAYYAMQIKGLELINRDPRTSPPCWASGGLVSSRGGDNVKASHMRYEILPPRPPVMSQLSEEEYAKWYVDNLDMTDEMKKIVFGTPPVVETFSFKGKAALLKWCEDHSTIENCLGLCIIGYRMGWQGGLESARAMLNALTGFELTTEDFERAAARIVALQRLYDQREGMERKDDHWPERFYREGVLGGPRAGSVLNKEEVEGFLREYYDLRGYDLDSGMPRIETAKELDPKWGNRPTSGQS